MIDAIKAMVKRFLLRNPTKANYKFVLRDWEPLLDLEASSEILETRRFSQNLDPVVLPGPEGRRLCVLAPHPDDEVFGCGGTLIRSLEAGADIHIVYITTGSRDTDRIPAIHREAKRSCKKLEATFSSLQARPNGIPITDEIAERLRAEVDAHDPDAIFLPFLLDDHDDHRRTNQLFARAMETGTTDGAEIWAYQVYSTLIPNVIVDITEVFDDKMTLIDLWESVEGDRDWAHYVKGLNALNSRFMDRDDEAYGESFFVLPQDEYLKLCQRYFDHPMEKIYHHPDYRRREPGTDVSPGS